ncbi:outer membrane beta-barrel protein [Salegentibacter sp. JZCK2]|uniref:outer membrane beta-barrel protein n=1 Tax=Salegentibacter tibetensis TaxID=2873600 RepID=UPI001CCD874B|nr:outer membrane beta-barrel protein [Salegentibacter tibetensis]MBZ9729452.1 outer membrane beta-barrel protein [Salegentibacter tibetensis]
MKKVLLSVILLCFSLSFYAQNFQSGYFINNKGERVECLIDNREELNNPESFQYKLSQGDQIKEKTIRDVQSFEVLHTPYKFQRAVVKLDVSQDDIKKLDTKREPNYKLDTLFLKVSIEGKASLYSYRSKNLPIRLFYSLNEEKIEPLISRKYLVDDTKIRDNNRYKQQLLNNLNCPSIDQDQISNLRYNEKSLNNIFTKYNACEKSDFVNYLKKRRKGEFNLSLKAGINYSAINFVQGEPFPNEQKSDAYLSPRIGVEMEYIFPFLNNRFSIVSYPSFQYSKTSNETLIYTQGIVPSNPDAWAAEEENLFIDYSHIMLPLGIRYYYYQGQNIDLYLQGAASLNILTNPSNVYNLENFNSNFGFENTTADPNLDFATGVKYKKLSLDIIYSVNSVMRNSGFNGEIQNPITLTFGYNFL